jgi:hypothetical protein
MMPAEECVDMDNPITYQVIGYEDAGGVPRVGQTALVRTTEQGLARFLTVQFLMWKYSGGNPMGEELAGYSAELRRGRCRGPLESGLWTPERHDDPVADIAYLDADTGSIEWQVNAPTYVVVTERDRTVITLSDRRR